MSFKTLHTKKKKIMCNPIPVHQPPNDTKISNGYRLKQISAKQMSKKINQRTHAPSILIGYGCEICDPLHPDYFDDPRIVKYTVPKQYTKISTG